MKEQYQQRLTEIQAQIYQLQQEEVGIRNIMNGIDHAEQVLVTTFQEVADNHKQDLDAAHAKIAELEEQLATSAHIIEVAGLATPVQEVSGQSVEAEIV